MFRLCVHNTPVAIRVTGVVCWQLSEVYLRETSFCTSVLEMFASNLVWAALVVSLCLVDGSFVGQWKRGRRTENNDNVELGRLLLMKFLFVCISLLSREREPARWFQ